MCLEVYVCLEVCLCVCMCVCVCVCVCLEVCGMETALQIQLLKGQLKVSCKYFVA